MKPPAMLWEILWCIRQHYERFKALHQNLTFSQTLRIIHALPSFNEIPIFLKSYVTFEAVRHQKHRLVLNKAM